MIKNKLTTEEITDKYLLVNACTIFRNKDKSIWAEFEDKTIEIDCNDIKDYISTLEFFTNGEVIRLNFGLEENYTLEKMSKLEVMLKVVDKLKEFISNKTNRIDVDINKNTELLLEKAKKYLKVEGEIK